MYACKENNIILLKVLNIYGVNLNGYDYDGRTALNIAASEGNLETLKYLISHGADLFHVDVRFNTPLDDSIRENRNEIV